MADAPAGLIGNFAANRPILAVSALVAGLMALSAIGLRNTGPDGFRLLLYYIFNAFYVVAAPLALVAIQPKRIFPRILFFMLIGLAGAGLMAAALNMVAMPVPFAPPPFETTLAAFLFLFFLAAMSPLALNVARLSIAASVAAIFGVIGAAGYHAAEGLWGTSQSAMAAALALALGVGAGTGIGADFAKNFTEGASQRRASATAGHSAIALSAYFLLCVFSFFAVQTFSVNFGAIEWRFLWAGVSMAAASVTAVLFIVVGALSLAPAGEQIAVDENHRRQWFAMSWRPIRAILPPTSAGAGAAIAGVVAIVALFEAGLSTPISLAVLFLLIGVSAAIAFVSLTASILIVSVLGVSAVFTGYVFAIFSIELPALPERLAALTLCAAALGALTVSWRDARDVWRNARDIAENAMNDGARRFLFLLGAGGASLFVSAKSFDWAGGIGSLTYFIMLGFFSLLLAPIMITAMSARTRRY
ncbi:MAG: hypothetical protein DHS20C05_09360 [Hyphococcus sp.]|nr:MAG: hypothetical protein DHS20C05_09360 [Marinicaulis sp.]